MAWGATLGGFFGSHCLLLTDSRESDLLPVKCRYHPEQRHTSKRSTGGVFNLMGYGPSEITMKRKVYYWVCALPDDIEAIRTGTVAISRSSIAPLSITRPRAIMYRSWYIGEDTDPFELALEIPLLRVYGLGSEMCGRPILKTYELSQKERETLLGRLKNSL